MDPKLFRTLRDALAQLYQDKADIRRVVADAGLNVARIDFEGSAVNSWDEVLREAEKHHQVEGVLQMVAMEYPDNRPFRAVYETYLQATGTSSKPQPPQVRRWWPVLLTTLALISVGGGSWYWRTYGRITDPNGERPQVAAFLTSTASQTATATVALTPTVTSSASTPTVAATVAPSPVAALLTITPTVAILATATALPVAPTTNALCVFAFLVLDEQSEAPIKGAALTVIVGVRQETGVSDSTGYFLAQLPCADAQVVAARVRVRAAMYAPYNRSVNLTGALTEIYLASTGGAATAESPTPTITPVATPTATVTAASSSDLQILDEGLTADTYLLEGAAIDQFAVGADLVVYAEPNPGVEVAIALLKVIGQSPTALSAQAILVDPNRPIRTRMRVDDNLNFLSTSQLVPVFDYAAGYLFRPGRVRLRPEHALTVGDQLQALEFERIDGEIIDALPSATIMEITTIGASKIVAAVELITGTWPVTGTIVGLVEEPFLQPTLTVVVSPTVTSIAEQTVALTPTATRRPQPPELEIGIQGAGAVSTIQLKAPETPEP